MHLRFFILEDLLHILCGMTVKSASDHPFWHGVFVCVSGGSLTSGQLLRALSSR